jgi:hypothetical protein
MREKYRRTEQIRSAGLWDIITTCISDRIPGNNSTLLPYKESQERSESLHREDTKKVNCIKRFSAIGSLAF